MTFPGGRRRFLARAPWRSSASAGSSLGYGLFSTTDGGTTWAKQPLTLPALDAISFTDATHGGVTHSMFSTVCRTEDGGRTWVAPASKATVTPRACAPVP